MQCHEYFLERLQVTQWWFDFLNFCYLTQIPSKTEGGLSYSVLGNISPSCTVTSRDDFQKKSYKIFNFWKNSYRNFSFHFSLKFILRRFSIFRKTPERRFYFTKIPKRFLNFSKNLQDQVNFRKILNEIFLILEKQYFKNNSSLLSGLNIQNLEDTDRLKLVRNPSNGNKFNFYLN